MTTPQPTTLAECSRIVSESFAALREPGLSPQQGYHLSEIVNAYLFASNLATTLGAIADEAVSIAKKQ